MRESEWKSREEKERERGGQILPIHRPEEMDDIYSAILKIGRRERRGRPMYLQGKGIQAFK